MISFTTVIQKFGAQGEKTGWTYILIPAELAHQLNPGVKKSYRVKGKLDAVAVASLALLPLGEGDFILALNGAMRKALKKGKNDTIRVQLERDMEEPKASADLLECLKDEPEALRRFQELSKGHQNYFSQWVESAKTAPTKAKRIAHALHFLSLGNTFGEMLRALKKEKSS